MRNPRRGRLGRALFAVLTSAVIVAVAVPVSVAARPQAVPGPPPSTPRALPALTPQGLAIRYAATRDDIEAAAQVAAEHGHHRRAAALRGMAVPGRRFLFFDGRDGGRAVEVFGDLSRARRVAVLVPGADIDLDRFARVHAWGDRLWRAVGGDSAVLVWLGYRTPGTFSVHAATTALAERAAPGLRDFVAELRAMLPSARVSLLCHSYGSLVCAHAAPGLDVSDVVLFGTVGVGIDHAAALRTRATVWAGRSSRDEIGSLPRLRLRLGPVTVGFGADPVGPEFGARVFDAGDGRHSDYLNAGSASLRNLAAIVSGRHGPLAGGDA